MPEEADDNQDSQTKNDKPVRVSCFLSTERRLESKALFFVRAGQLSLPFPGQVWVCFSTGSWVSISLYQKVGLE